MNEESAVSEELKGKALMKIEWCWGDVVNWMYFHRGVRVTFLETNEV